MNTIQKFFVILFLVIVVLIGIVGAVAVTGPSSWIKQAGLALLVWLWAGICARFLAHKMKTKDWSSEIHYVVFWPDLVWQVLS